MSEDTPHILVVDDDDRLRDLLRRYLSDHGFLISTAANAAEARRQLSALAFDLIILDVMMPGESGLELSCWLHEEGRGPVLMLTAMSEPEQRVNGLETGAEDYLAKPFEPRELVLRIKNILRRVGTPTVPQPQPVVRLGDFLFDVAREELRRGFDRIRLTSAEASLLRVFAENPGVTLSRDDLTERARITGNARTVDVQITRLRRKIERDPRLPRYLQTVRGEGYVLRPDG